MNNTITVIGAAIIDILAGAVDEKIISRGSSPMDSISMSYGGDALNEAVVMSRLGLSAEIVTKVGGDDAGRQVIDYLMKNGVTCRYTVDDTIETGINIVLVDKEGERSFLTNPKSSLRKLSLEDIIDKVDDMGDIVCFASMFVSPLLGVSQMEELFRKIKEKPQRKLVVDMTTAKKGETIEDIKCLLRYIDYIIPNETEAKLLSGVDDARTNADLLYEAGCRCVIVKCSKEGCIIRDDLGLTHIPAIANVQAIDTTGAGDAFAAGFVWGLQNGLSNRDSARFACAVSSCVVEKMGSHTAIESIDEPMKRYRNE